MQSRLIFGDCPPHLHCAMQAMRDSDTPDARGQPEAFAPRWEIARPRRFFTLGSGEGIVEWHQPGRPVSERQFVSLTTLRKRVDREASLPVALFIFHCGRCGSTLLGRMLELERSNRVLLEPIALQRFFELNRERLDRPEVRQDLQTLVASYGLDAAPEERHLAIKLSSLTVLQVAHLRDCFPGAQLLYLLREPTEVVASDLRGLASFLRPEYRGELAAVLDGATRPLEAYSDAEWCAWYIDRNLRIAARHAGMFNRVIDYTEYRTAYLEVCSALSSKPWSADDPEMAAVLGSYSKQPGARYSPEEDARKVPAGLREIVEPITREAYHWWRERLQPR